MAEDPRNIVAIIDDDEAVRLSLRFLMEVLGHRVETFASGADFMKSAKERLLCLIVDYHMPGMTGLELTERLRAKGNKVPIMLTTGLPSQAIYARAAELGIDEVLEKPLDEVLLLAFIDTAKRRVC